ncbi:hypothetical protein EON63_21510 [archaeon]|nr:MAG: hypothetical protein EON63_21510 [archaeon]
MVEVCEYDQLSHTAITHHTTYSPTPTTTHTHTPSNIHTQPHPYISTHTPSPDENTPHNLPSPYLGVRLVYTHTLYRRLKIAEKLLDAARRYHWFGEVASKDTVAFSQPTEMGFVFAGKYVGKERVKCYV